MDEDSSARKHWEYCGEWRLSHSFERARDCSWFDFSNMNAKQALAWVRKCGVSVESARANIPSLAHIVAGPSLRGSWWAHPMGNDIFLLSRAIRRSPEVLVCRLMDGKITYVHRRLWPALVRAANRFPKGRLAAIAEVHTAAGSHRVVATAFPKWVPKEVLREAKQLTEREALAQLRMLRGDG